MYVMGVIFITNNIYFRKGKGHSRTDYEGPEGE
jgi:hypothetical protein